MKLSNKETIALLAKDNYKLFSAAFDKLRGYLRRVSYNILKSDEEADDVVNEVYIEAAENLFDFKGNSTLKTWLTSITKNKSIDRYNYKKKNPTFNAFQSSTDDMESVYYEDWLAKSTGKDYCPVYAFEINEFKEYLDHYISELPKPIREPFRLYHIEGHPYARISRMLGLTVNTVTTRSHKAMRQIKKKLRKKYYETYQEEEEI